MFSLVLLLLACLGGLTSSLSAASQLNFPRLSFDGITGIAIVNPTAQDAEVSLTVYGEDGQPAQPPGFTNPATVLVPAGQQISQVAEDIFGGRLDPEVVAWIQGTSPVDGLTGFFLSLDATPTFFDGADLPQLSNRIVFPEVCLRSDCTTELNLINPGDSQRQVDIEILGLDQPVMSQVLIPARGVSRLDAGQLVQEGLATAGAEMAGSGYIIASADGAIGGFEFVRQEVGDLLGLNAKPADELLNTIFFPQLAVLDPFQSQITVVNLGDTETLVTFRAFRPDGEPYGPADLSNNPVSHTLEAGERFSSDVETLFGFRGEETLSGWILAESTSISINGSLTYAIPSIQSLAAVASQAQGMTSAVFSHIATTLGFFTGIAILNPGSLPANVRIVALKPDGTILGSFTTVVQPRQRIARLIDELIPGAAGQAGGFIIIRSNIPVLLTSLFGSLGSGILANVPPQRIPNSFRPDDVIPQLRLNPPLAVVPPGQDQTFQIQGIEGVATWSVNDVEGGTPGVGTIDASGHYQAPATMPSMLPVTIAGEVDEQRAAASVDVLVPQTLVQNLGEVQSIAYLEGLRQLFSAELSTQVTLGVTPGKLGTTFSSQIFDVTSESHDMLLELPGEDVRHMIPFKGVDGREYLLLAANTSGQVIRLDPTNGTLVPVAADLPGPSALSLDPIGGDLFVAAGSQVLSVSRSNLNTGLTSAAVTGPTPRLEPARGVGFLNGTLSGLAVNPCDGNIVVSDSENGQLVQIDRETGQQTVLEDVTAGHLLFLLRLGIGCPQGAQVLGVEPDMERVFLRSYDGDVITWAMVPEPSSLAELPEGSPFETEDGIVISQRLPESDLFIVETPGIYRPDTPAINPPFIPPLQPGGITYSFTGVLDAATPNLELEENAPASGIFFFDPGQAEAFPVTEQAVEYVLSGGSGVEVTIAGKTFRAFLTSENNQSDVTVVNDFVSGGDPPVDQLLWLHGNSIVVFNDTVGGTLLDSLALPESINYDPETMTGYVNFNFLEGGFGAFSVRVTSVQRTN